MKKLVYSLLTVLIALPVFVSCNKNNPAPGGNDDPSNIEEPEASVPDVVSDLVIGEQSFPVRTFNGRHALSFAGLNLFDEILFYENIASVPGGYYNPACVLLGDGSIQDIYDQMLPKKINALFIITDKKLKADDFTIYDELPVAILPESALAAIQPAIVHFSEDGEEYDYIKATVKPREGLLSPASPITGKQWIFTSIGDLSAAFLDINHSVEGKAFSIPLAYGLAYTPPTVTYSLPDKFASAGSGDMECRPGQSDTEFTIINSKNEEYKHTAVSSLGKYVLVRREQITSSGTKNTIMSIFSPVPHPVTAWPYDYDLMVSVDGKDYPLACNLSSGHSERFLALGSKVPFLFLDAAGTPEDFEGKDVRGKIVGVNRGSITFKEKQLYAKNAGAAAVICVNNQEGLFRAETDPESIPFGIMDLNVKSILKNASEISLAPFHTLEE